MFVERIGLTFTGQALTTADVGIAIGSGSDVAISSASFILVKSNLRSILTLTDLSRRVFNRVKFNFVSVRYSHATSFFANHTPSVLGAHIQHLCVAHCSRCDLSCRTCAA